MRKQDIQSWSDRIHTCGGASVPVSTPCTCDLHLYFLIHSIVPLSYLLKSHWSPSFPTSYSSLCTPHTKVCTNPRQFSLAPHNVSLTPAGSNPSQCIKVIEALSPIDSLTGVISGQSTWCFETALEGARPGCFIFCLGYWGSFACHSSCVFHCVRGTGLLTHGSKTISDLMVISEKDQMNDDIRVPILPLDAHVS